MKIHSWNMTHPELTTFKTCIIPDFLDVRGVCLHFIRRDNSERDISYVKDPIALQQYSRNISMSYRHEPT
jgi:hypothetical protein